MKPWKIYLFAPMRFDNTHARKHAFVESCRALGLDAVYVEPANSGSPYLEHRTLNGGELSLSVPGGPRNAPDDTPVLSLPKKLGIGPLRVALPRTLQEKLQERWLRKFFETVSDDAKRLAIVASPRWEPLLRHVHFDRLLFDHTDAVGVLRGWLPEAAYLERRRALVARSDAVLAVSPALAREVREESPESEIRLVPNGVDVEHFERHRFDPVPELEGVSEPVIGFVGTVANWVDINQLAACADAYPEWCVAVAGPVNSGVDTHALERRSNVRMIGRLPWERVPAVMQAMDVALMPFLPGDVSDVANPITLYEWLYLGKPVVCSPMPELQGIEEHLYMGDESFVSNIARAAAEPRGELQRARSAIGRAHSWKSIVEGTLRESAPELFR